MEEGSLEGVKARKDTTTARAQGQTGHGEETFPPLSPLTVQYLAKVSHWPSPRWRQRGGESWTCNLYGSCKGQLPRMQGGHRTVENGWGPSKWRTACKSPAHCSLLKGGSFCDHRHLEWGNSYRTPWSRSYVLLWATVLRGSASLPLKWQ